MSVISLMTVTRNASHCLRNHIRYGSVIPHNVHVQNKKCNRSIISFVVVVVLVRVGGVDDCFLIFLLLLVLIEIEESIFSIVVNAVDVDVVVVVFVVVSGDGAGTMSSGTVLGNDDDDDDDDDGNRTANIRGLYPGTVFKN